MADDESRRVDPERHTLSRYPCGIAAGDRLRLIRRLVLENHLGLPMGEVIPAGSIWRVLPGLPAEPSVIWFEDPRGELHTWDAESLWSDFQMLDTR